MILLISPFPKPEDGKTPGEKLLYYRLLHDMSQSELAEKLGFTHWGIVNLEKGLLEIYYDLAVKLGEIFHVSPNAFLDEYSRFCRPGYGKRIQMIRKSCGMTQLELSAYLGCARATVAFWEAEIGNHHPARNKYRQLKTLAQDKGIEQSLFEEGDTL